LISPDKIDEWLHEVEERPDSAALIIRYIANRLSELTSREEELAAENIELLSGRKVEEYESRIASLEYQLELLKRQLGGEIILPGVAPAAPPIHETVSLVVYNPFGKVLRLEIEPVDLSSNQTIARIAGEVAEGELQPNVLATTSLEELLFIFDSGRTVAHPLNQLPVQNREELAWEKAFLEEPRIKEELVAIHPIARMLLFDFCIQVSRRGYVKKIKMQPFMTHLAEDYIGSGVKLPADKTCGLTFANPENVFVMVSQEGFIFCMPVVKLPTAIEDVIQLGISDHIVSSFIIDGERSLLFFTQNGKAVHREVSWLEPANSFKSRGQPLLSKERREAGIRLVGAAPVDEASWGLFLHTDGALRVHTLEDLLATGSVDSEPGAEQILASSIFPLPEKSR